MDVSVIMCTRNRCGKLVRCLATIVENKSEIDWELIVIDNGSTDETPTMLVDFAHSVSVPFRCVSQPRGGLGSARNAGIEAARGEILAFTDDDCYPRADFVTRIYRVFRDDPALGYIGGRILLHDPDDLPLTINESTVSLSFPGRSYRQPGDVMGANMAFRREVLIEIGGFDPLFGAGSLFPAEDIDAVGRASAIGWSGRYCPEVVVSHHHGRKAADLAAMWKSYSIGRGAYDMKQLLRGEFWWFARSIYGLRRRYRLDSSIIYWEQVGKIKFLLTYLKRNLLRDFVNENDKLYNVHRVN